MINNINFINLLNNSIYLYYGIVDGQTVTILQGFTFIYYSGETEDNVKKLIQGQLPGKLNELGLEQAKVLFTHQAYYIIQ